MRGSIRENFKNAAISVLIGILAAQSIVWRDTFCQIGGGYLVAQIIWVFMTAYDEVLRKRRESRRRPKKENARCGNI